MTAVPDGVELATAYVTVVPDGSKIGPELKRQFGVADKEADRVGRTSGKKFGSAFGAGLKLVGGAAIGAGLVKGYNASVDAASDLSETVNKSTVIFGKNSAAIDKWANGADRSLGLSKQAALESAAGFGDMFDQIGFSGDAAAKLSKKVVQMSADLGSFNNLGTDEVADRISAAFRGEYDSLQALIPNINAARVESVALGQTHKKTAKELTAAEKATAVLAIVQKDGARASGDFARTSDGLANSQKIQAAEVENLKAKIGSGLLPVQLKLTRFMSDKAVPAVSDFVDGIQDGTGAGGKFADAARDIGSGLKDVFEVGKDVVGVLDSLPGPVKKFGVQTAVALVVLSKVKNVLGPATGSLTGFATGLRNVETRAATTARGLAAVKSGAASLAGGAGLGLIASTAGSSNEKLRTLGSVGGGALLGFSVAGPVGAAVGSLAGGLFALGNQATDASDKARDSLGGWKAYAETLDAVNGATTAATRAFAKQRLETAQVLDTTRGLGLEDRKVVNAIVDGGKARIQVVTQLNAQKKALDAVYQAQLKKGTNSLREKQELRELEKQTIARKKEIDAVLREVGAVTKAVAEKQKEIAVTKDYGNALAKLPEEKRILVEAVGIIPTIRGVATLASKISATDKDLKVLIAASGVKTTVGEIRKVQDKLNLLDGRKVTVGVGVLIKTSSDLGTLLNDKLGIPRRALGGPVTAGQPYIVGEHRPELFVPNQSGRIAPRVPGGVASSPVSLAGQRLALLVAGQQIEGVIVDLADTRVGAQKGVDAMTERAFG